MLAEWLNYAIHWHLFDDYEALEHHQAIFRPHNMSRNLYITCEYLKPIILSRHPSYPAENRLPGYLFTQKY